MKNKFIIVFTAMLMGLAALFNSCKKFEYPPEYSKAQINFKMLVGTAALEWDTVKYTNAAGNKFGVNTVNFYVSGLTLKRTDGKLYISKKIFYIDPSNSTKNYFKLDSIPPGSYTQISFNLGVDTAKNKTLVLPATTDNLNMAWPDLMGGGYHFLKLEGNYLDTLNVKKGFAIHLGKNNNLPLVKFNCTMNQKYWDHQYSLSFNINEVFTNPSNYNFNFDSNYTMTDSLAMNKIKNNIVDVFSIKQDN